MTAIIDYGVGNLFSLKCSLASIGEETVVTDDKEVIFSADRIILPGVGAFSDATDKLEKSGLKETVLHAAKLGIPILGICLGMQLLFEKSYEFGEFDGLSLIKGSVRSISEKAPDVKIPHIGWNCLNLTEKKSELYKYINNGDFVYFVHSFAGTGCEEFVTAFTDYGAEITASVENGKVFGVQYHPEKSGETGLKILKAFCEVTR